MYNFVFVSPHFPDYFWYFVKALKEVGFNVLGIGDCPYENLQNELKENLCEYYFCQDMENFENEKAAVKYYKDKYINIDFLESLNEYWLERDAKLREIFDIKNGVRPDQLLFWQKKSYMKEKYKEAGLKTAKFKIVTTIEEIETFITEVGYPVFIKPNIGVGAAGDYKIKNHNDLEIFFKNRNLSIEYICEQYLTGNIISFDGITDNNNRVIFSSSNFFPPSIAEIVKNRHDLFYYTLSEVPKKLLEIGKKTISAFKVNQRYFRLEFFILTEDILGFAKKGEIIPLETNMRPAGGYTPHMINFANSIDTFKIYANVMKNGTSEVKSSGPHFYCACASRRDKNVYKYSDDEVCQKYKDYICMSGRYAEVLSGAMGNRYFIAKFTNIDDMNDFKMFVEERYE